MEVGVGVLGWSPPHFWMATPHELMAALDGYKEKNGLKAPEAMGSERLKELMAQHPDG